MNILILTAMKSESQSLLDRNLNNTKSLDDGIRLDGKNTIFVMESGVGPVSSGIMCERYIKKYSIDLVVLVGLAGGLDQSLREGDHIIGRRIYQHDAFCEYENKIEPMAPGRLHLSLSPSERPNVFLETSEKYSKIISDYLLSMGEKVQSGDIVSGSSFIGRQSSKIKLKERFPDSLAVEMEGIGVALAANNNDIPFVIAKTLADSINKSITNDYIDFVKSEKEKCANIISCFL